MRAGAAALLCVLLAAPAQARGHRGAAETAERLGRYREAAREYALAFEAERAPELLYRLGICRRRLRQYARARDAFRGYLREAPEGALKDDSERQIAQLDILLAEEARVPRRLAPPRAPSFAAVIVVRPPPPPEMPPLAAPRALPFTPLLATVPPVAFAEPRPPRVAPWIAAGAGALAVAGGILWWDGARVARDLDARFAAGDLAAADSPRYGRARAESIAGRILVGAAVAGAAAAVLLWR